MPAAEPVTRLVIDGVTIDAARARGDVLPRRMLVHSFDGPDELEFTEFGALSPTYRFSSRVELYVAEDLDASGTIVEADYRLYFRGHLLRAPFRFDQGTGPTLEYVAAGLKWAAAQIPVRHPQSELTEIEFNLPPDDPNYDEDLAGLELGEILRRVLTYDYHATQLWNAGVEAYTNAPPYDTEGGAPPVLKAATLSELAAMTIVPMQAVRFAGTKLWNEVENVVQEWAPWVGLEIEANGTIRMHDTRDPLWLELMLGSDPLELPSFSYDASECYTAVEILGSDQVEGRFLSTDDGSLVEDWRSDEEELWTWADFAEPSGAISQGAILTLGPTTVTIAPETGAGSWAVNRWSNDDAFMVVENPLAQGQVTYSETRRIVANQAWGGAGSCTITLDYPLANSGYTRYRITARAGGRSHIHRRYDIYDNWAAANIVERFPFPVPYSTITGTKLVDVPVGVNKRSDDGEPDYFESLLFFQIITENGTRKILTNEPTVKPWTAQADLDLGGDNVTKPSVVEVFVPVSVGQLTVRYPASGWSGTGYTDHNIQRVRYVPMPDWKYVGDTERMREYAQAIHETVKDVTIEGEITYLGLWGPGLRDANVAAKLTSVHGTTPWETTKLNVRGVEVTWPIQGPHIHETRLRLSNQRRPWTGDRYYSPQSFLDGDPLAGRELDLRGDA